MDSVNKLFISTLQQTISLIKNKKSTLSELKMVMLHRLYATTPPLNFCNIGPKPAVYFRIPGGLGSDNFWAERCC